MSEEFLHGGVPRASGVVHVGPAHRRVGKYLRDAQGYARSGLDWSAALERERLETLAKHAENMRRSYVCALAALLSWLNGDTSLGGVSGEPVSEESGSIARARDASLGGDR